MFKRKSFRTLFHTLLICSGCLFLNIPDTDSSLSNKVHVIQLEDASINPVTSEYITKSIDRAEDEDVRLLVIEIDTPGGLLSSTRSIVKRMLTAKVPVGGIHCTRWFASGISRVFITYASHIAAMAPSTNIGAAHPIKMGGGSTPKKGGEWGELKKLLEDIRNAQQISKGTNKTDKNSGDVTKSSTPDTDSLEPSVPELTKEKSEDNDFNSR